MHIVKDENGNICPHGHGNTHEHSHEHGHCHEHSHDHKHKEGCGGCGGGCEQKAGQNEAVLNYMLQHNQSHAAELDQLAAKFSKEGMEDIGEQIKKAVDEYEKGNLYLGLALAMIKEK